MSNKVTAQEQVEISGQVKDAISKLKIEFCVIKVFNENDSLITGAMTDKNGFFVIPVEPNNYNLVISFMGYKSDTIRAVTALENVFLGVFKLVEDATLLNEVSITANSYENQLDKDVQIVTDQLIEGTASTKEVLDKINGVDIDRYSNTIKVDNDSKVIILVDGMQKDQEYIKNISPDRLKKIEITRDPGGRYALEGYSAVINVILKKDYQGIEIFTTERTMQDIDASESKYIPVQSDFSTTINYTYSKLNVYAKYNNLYNSFNLQSTRNRKYSNCIIIDQVPLSNDKINTNVNQLYHNYTFGTDYFLNPKHTISFECNLQTQPLKHNETDVFYNIIYSQNDIDLNNYRVENYFKSQSLNSTNTLFYEWKINENNVLNSNFTFSKYQDKTNSINIEGLINTRTEDVTNDENRTKSFIEFTHTFNTKVNLQVGYGNSWQLSHSTINVIAVDSVYSNNFEYSDLRNKLYAYFSYQITDKLGIKFGCAGETSSPISNGQNNNYIIYQPYADIKFKPNDMIDIKAKYRASSNYPTMNQTNPFTTMLDQQSVKTGNPYLKPEVTNKISLQMNILGGLATIEPYYHFANNYITEIGTMRVDSIFEYNYSNNGDYEKYGIEAGITIPFGKSLFLQSNLDFFKSNISFSDKVHNVNDWMMMNQLIYMNEKSGTLVGFQYQKNLFKSITAQGYNKWNNDYWLTFVQQTFFKEKLSVMLIYFLPIDFGVDYMQGNYVQTDTYEELNLNDIGFLKNMVMLEINYRFNNGKTVNKNEKEIEIENQKKTNGLF
jgi:hypothetical protein